MKIVVRSTDSQLAILQNKGIPEGSALVKYENKDEAIEADAYFDLLFEEEGPAFLHIQSAPVFVNAVISCYQALSPNQIRLNAWPGFLGSTLLEIATTDSPFFKKATDILHKLNWAYQEVPDSIGLIAPRIIAMIINEAYFGLDENISSRADIDIAMKLGTNYPFGPFEWGELIGLDKIVHLLAELGDENERYKIAPGLLSASKKAN